MPDLRRTIDGAAPAEDVRAVPAGLDRLDVCVDGRRGRPARVPADLGEGTPHSQTPQAGPQGRSRRLHRVTSFGLPGGAPGPLAAKAAARGEGDAEATPRRVEELVER